MLLHQQYEEEGGWVLLQSLLHPHLREYRCPDADDYDCVYVAHCYPYTYTRLMRYLKSIESDPHKRNLFQRKPLCLTESGNPYDTPHAVVTSLS